MVLLNRRSSYRREPSDVRQGLFEALAAGPKLDYDSLVKLSREADRYIMAVLREARLDPAKQVEALGALSPTPPSYSEPLVEVTERLAAQPTATASLPRLLDWRVAEVELGQELGPVPGLERPSEDGDRLSTLGP